MNPGISILPRARKKSLVVTPFLAIARASSGTIGLFPFGTDRSKTTAVLIIHRISRSVSWRRQVIISSARCGHVGSTRNPTFRWRSDSRLLIHPLLQAAHTCLVRNRSGVIEPWAFNPVLVLKIAGLNLWLRIAMRFESHSAMTCSLLSAGESQNRHFRAVTGVGT